MMRYLDEASVRAVLRWDPLSSPQWSRRSPRSLPAASFSRCATCSPLRKVSATSVFDAMTAGILVVDSREAVLKGIRRRDPLERADLRRSRRDIRRD